jgi:hypothetical protein
MQQQIDPNSLFDSSMFATSDTNTISQLDEAFGNMNLPTKTEQPQPQPQAPVDPEASPEQPKPKHNGFRGQTRFYVTGLPDHMELVSKIEAAGIMRSHLTFLDKNYGITTITTSASSTRDVDIPLAPLGS